MISQYKERTLSLNFELQMAELFSNSEKSIKPGSWFKAIFGGVRHAKTAEKAENHSKGGPFDATVGKSGQPRFHINLEMD